MALRRPAAERGDGAAVRPEAERGDGAGVRPEDERGDGGGARTAAERRPGSRKGRRLHPEPALFMCTRARATSPLVLVAGEAAAADVVARGRRPYSAPMVRAAADGPDGGFESPPMAAKTSLAATGGDEAPTRIHWWRNPLCGNANHRPKP